MSKYSDKVKRRLEAAAKLADTAARTAKTTAAEPFARDATQRARAVNMADQCAQMAVQLRDLTKSLETLTRKFEFLEDLHLKTAAKNTAQKRHIATLTAALAGQKTISTTTTGLPHDQEHKMREETEETLAQPTDNG